MIVIYLRNKMEDAKVLIGKASAQQSQHLENVLSQHGIEVVTIHNKMTCQSGCSTELEIWANPNDLAQISQILNDRHSEELRDLNYDPKLLHAVYDDTKTHATCPACGHEFETCNTECPDCGLVFAAPMGGGGKCSSGSCK
jgi:ribosomal protein S27E